MIDNNPDLLIHLNVNMGPEKRIIAGKLMKEVYTNTSFVDDFGAYIRVSLINYILKL